MHCSRIRWLVTRWSTDHDERLTCCCHRVEEAMLVLLVVVVLKMVTKRSAGSLAGLFLLLLLYMCCQHWRRIELFREVLVLRRETRWWSAMENSLVAKEVSLCWRSITVFAKEKLHWVIAVWGEVAREAGEDRRWWYYWKRERVDNGWSYQQEEEKKAVVAAIFLRLWYRILHCIRSLVFLASSTVFPPCICKFAPFFIDSLHDGSHVNK